MSEFRRISKTSSFVTGSLESETGSEYLFGYSDADGLMWLERKGKQYSASDKEWRKADAFLRSSLSSESIDVDGAGDVDEAYEVEEQRPATVRRSAAVEYEMGTPQLTSSMVGMGSRNIDDDDLVGRAIAFLSDINGFSDVEDYEEASFDDNL